MRARKGFTLIEVLLVMVILAMIIVIVTITLFAVHSAATTQKTTGEISDLPAEIRVERYGKTLGSEVARMEAGEIIETKEGFFILTNHRVDHIVVTNTSHDFLATPDEVIRIIHRSDPKFADAINIMVRATHGLATPTPTTQPSQ